MILKRLDMIRMNKLFTTALALGLVLNACGQSPMTMEGAIQEALSKNYSVQISRNNVAASENLATRGQAGQLPTVSGSGSADYGNDNTRLQLAGSPDVIETTAAESYTYNAGVSAKYTVFAGGANKNTYQKLMVNADLSDAESRVNIESTIMQVVSAYYNVLRTQDNFKALKETLGLSRQRLELSKKQRELSGGSKINVLNAKVDLNKDSVGLVNAAQAVEEAEIGFNQALVRDLATPVVLQLDSIITPAGDFETLKSTMFAQNSEVKAARLNMQASMLDFKISKSAYMPQLDLTSSYSYARSEAEGSFLLLNESNGLGLTLSLSIPIYAGGTRKAAVANNQLKYESQELQLKSTELSLESRLMLAHTDYERALNIVGMEQQNLALNVENFEYTNQQYELGLVSNTDFRQAQVNLLLTKNSLNNVRYNLRLAELELKRLTGALIVKS
jgi:outer membrane protein